MARITLKKIAKPSALSATAKPLSSRAKRAQLQGQRHKPLTPATVVTASAPSAASRMASASREAVRAAPAPQSDRASSSPPAKKASRRGKPSPAEGTGPRTAAGTPGSTSADRREPVGAARRRTDRGRPRSASAGGARVTPCAVPTPNRDRPPRHEKPDNPRLSKRMSEMGLCSRREADEWIENGWVTVDGNVVDVLGARVSPFARIEVAKAAARHQSEQVTILLNKPIGYVSGQAEDGHTPAMELIKPENRWADDPSDIAFKRVHLRGLAPAGRLDIDSTGLIVFTQDGRVAKRLIGSHSEVEKEYLVRVEGKLDAAGMKLLQHGLELDGVKLKPARVSWQNEDQLRFVLREGRKRQIRRMCELIGLTVTGLKRVRSGSVSLGPLPVGRWRYLRRDEKF